MIHAIRGVKDILPAEMPRWHAIESHARRVSALHGFHEIRVPMFEVTELFARSIGASTDIVEKEMYTFQDRDGKSITLRPEATAGVVRAYIEHHLYSTSASQKFFYLGPMFRHERPQAGRLRQFHQFGVESFGTSAPEADAEVITLLWRFLAGLSLTNLTLEINSLGDAADRPRYVTALTDFLKPREAHLCDNCRRRMVTNPLRVLDCKQPGCKAATETAPRMTDYLSPGAKDHFEAVMAALTGAGLHPVLNPRLVRGLDYYCRTTFEMTTSQLGAQNAVGAGGRYDGLVEILGGPRTPGVGFAVGLERVALMLPESAARPDAPLLFVAGFGDRGRPAGLRLLGQLREAGLRADTHYDARNLKALLRHADRLTAAFAVIVGDDEAAADQVILRNMTTKDQQAVPITTVVSHLQVALKNP